MPARQRLRFVPALAVTLLLCLAAAAPPRNGAGPAPPPQFQPPCDDFASAVTGDSSAQFSASSGLEQALPAGMSVASCSLSTAVPAYYGPNVDMTLRGWDPTTLAPDPTAIALRRAFFNPSNMLYAGGKMPRATFVPPVVTSSVPGVAEPPASQVAIQIATDWDWAGQSYRAFFNPEGPTAIPAAVKFHLDGSREPLPGAHPVLAHAVCAGDADLLTLRVVQSVARTNIKPFPAPREFLQRFRVPQEVELRWVELALAEVFVPYFEQVGDPSHLFWGIKTPQLAIIDGDDLPHPVPNMPASLVEAPISIFSGTMRWISHTDFDHTVTLKPEHDYWIYVRDANATTFFNRRVQHVETSAFKEGIGPYFARSDTAGEWNQTADQVLAFHIVGKPTPLPL